VTTAVYHHFGPAGCDCQLISRRLRTICVYPEKFWLDQSFEFRSQAWQEWAAQRGIEILYGAPYQKAMIARRFLDELRIFLGDHRSTKPGDLKRNLAEWRRTYKAAAAATN
jgi:transposase InsO family protein